MKINLIARLFLFVVLCVFFSSYATEVKAANKISIDVNRFTQTTFSACSNGQFGVESTPLTTLKSNDLNDLINLVTELGNSGLLSVNEVLTLTIQILSSSLTAAQISYLMALYSQVASAAGGLGNLYALLDEVLQNSNNILDPYIKYINKQILRRKIRLKWMLGLQV